MLHIISDSASEIFAESLRGPLEAATALARKLMPEIPKDVTIEFEDRRDDSGVGVSGYPRAVGVTVLAWDPFQSDKAMQLMALKSEVLHHCYHWCQGYTFESPTAAPETALEAAVYEGAATAFARDYTLAEPLWSDYSPLPPATLQAWREELDRTPVAVYAATPELWRSWVSLQEEPDESWRLHRVGTWIVDEYLRLTDESVIDLRHRNPKEILNSLK